MQPPLPDAQYISPLGRGLSRPVGNCRSGLSLSFTWLFMRDIGHDMSRLVVAGRGLRSNDVAGLGVRNIECDWSRHVAARRARDLLDLLDVPRDRRRGDQIFFAEGSFLPKAIEMTLRTISLDAANGARMPGVFVAKGGLFDSEGIVVGAGRVLSRRVVGHVSKSNPPRRLSGWLSTVRYRSWSRSVVVRRRYNPILFEVSIHAPARGATRLHAKHHRRYKLRNMDMFAREQILLPVPII
jgi:hypothetical protein